MERTLERIEALVLRDERFRTILESVTRGEISHADAYSIIETLLVADGHGDLLDEARALTITEEPVDVPIVMETTGGMPLLNPLMQAFLAESIVLDGDAPAMRSGPPPEGFTPAVPVLTDAADPVIVGLMLETAAEEVRASFEEANARIASGETALTRMERVTGVPGYEAGSPPAFRSVRQPTPIETALLTPERRRELARKSLVTGQGRSSLVPALTRAVERHLRARGVRATPTRPMRQASRITWTIDGVGIDELNESFSPIEAAAAYFAERLADLEGGVSFHVEVRPAAGDRRFGWFLHYTHTEDSP